MGVFLKLCGTRNNKIKRVKIEEVFLHGDFYYVKPSQGSYEMIYRAAKGVYWDDKLGCLYFKGITTRENALKIIIDAVKCEYNTLLKV